MPLDDFRFRSTFGIFFDSVKKVSNPSIFCEITCVSKRTLVILKRMLYCTAFFKVKNSIILFFLSLAWFINGEGISLEVVSPGANFLGGKILRGNFHRGNIHRGYFHRGTIFFFWGGGVIFQGTIFLIPFTQNWFLYKICHENSKLMRS